MPLLSRLPDTTFFYYRRSDGTSDYQVSRSLRFNSADSAYLDRTPSVAGNPGTWTWSGWVKRGSLTSSNVYTLFSASEAVSRFTTLRFYFDNIQFYSDSLDSDSVLCNLITTATYKDPSAWMHIIFTLDTTNATESDRFKLYVNGVRVTDFSTETYPSLNGSSNINSIYLHELGSRDEANYFDGYLAEVNFIDGQALDPSSFGAFDTNGVWQPKEYTFTSVINTSQVWSNNVIGDLGNSDPVNAFNGLLGSGSNTERVRPPNGTTAGYSFSGLGTVNSLRIWVVKDGAGGSVFNVNGTDVTSTVDAAPNNTWVDFGSTFTSLTEITFDAVDGSNWYGIAGVEVNGQLLIDTGVRTDNSFYLPFGPSDLGADLSGNGNDWTANNFVTPGIMGDWISTISSPTGTVSNPVNAFDGSIVSGASTYTSGTADELLVTFPTPIVATTSFRVWAQIPTSSNSTCLLIGYYKNGVRDAQICGNSQGNSQAAVVYDMGPGTYNSIEVKEEQVYANQGIAIYAIEVDGVMLMDNTKTEQIDSVVDSPTNGAQADTGVGGEVVGNYCTWNSAASTPNILSNGNLETTFTNNNSAPFARDTAVGTISVSSGKYYWEVDISGAGLDVNKVSVGIFVGGIDYTDTPPLGFRYDSGNLNDTSAKLGLALDVDAGTLRLYENNVNTYTETFTANSLCIPAIAFRYNGSGSAASTCNFGQQPFTYTAPAGFKALCTANLPESTVPNGRKFMDVVLYTGNGGTQTISGLNFSPDLVWIKNRVQGDSHKLTDTVRGATKEIQSNATSAEVANADGLTAFNSDGFNLGGDNAYNTNGETYVAWSWKVGSSTVSNTDGTITSQVRANPSAGFSIVSYTGSGANATIGHGLNATPEMIIVKNRDGTLDWNVYHAKLDASSPENYYLRLNLNNTRVSSSVTWNDTSPTNSVFSVGTSENVNGNTQDLVAYCFASVDGYSYFGSYTGNGSANGPFVYTGFRPRWVMIKKTTSGSWVILDTARSEYNITSRALLAHSSVAEDSTQYLDILSNGFKITVLNASTNTNAQEYVVMAFAENPFKTARAR